MIVSFNDTKNNKVVGNKAKFLMAMKEAGFNVPDGFVIDSDTYEDEIKYNKISSEIETYLKKINKDNIKDISMEICSFFDSFNFSKKVESEILSRLKDDKLYAVRSSGTKEDLD